MPPHLNPHTRTDATARHASGLLAGFLLSVVLTGTSGWLLGLPASAAESPVAISEFMASNHRTLKDDAKTTSDWIEIHKRGSNTLSLAGYSLTDQSSLPRKWMFPDLSLAPQERAIVFASGSNHRDPSKPLHTSFKLSAEGGYLALMAPDGHVATEFRPSYPAQFPDLSFGFARPNSGQPTFLPRPTPGRPNYPEGVPEPPILSGPDHSPRSPQPGQPLRISIRASTETGAIRSVTAYHRMDHRPEQALILHDDGSEGDATPRDGVWSGTIPTIETASGSMIRWRFVALNDAGATNRWPLHPRPDHSARYLGTVLSPERVTSALPVFHLFIDPSRVHLADSDEGTRASLFYDGEFYDNLLIKLRGNTSASFPKKSHRLEFTSEHPFRHPGPGPRIRNTSLLAEWADPTYLRQHLSFWIMAQAGVPAPFHDPVRLQLNGRFHQLALHSQVLGEELLERTGLDPRGALYKAVGTVTPDQNSTGGFEKKTRREEDDQDYTEFTRAIAMSRNGSSRATALFDRCDLPAVINYLVIARMTQEDDDIWANMSLYRDSLGSRLWRPVAFDMNVSWGFSFASGGILASSDDRRSHPFWGAAGIGESQGYNQLYDAIIRTPATREMFLRRMRTLLDRFLQPPETPPGERILERHLEELRLRMAPEAALDRQLWGLPWTASRGSTPANALDRGISALNRQFIQPRRIHLYATHSATNTARRIGVGTDLIAGLPGPQPEHPAVRISGVHPEGPAPQHWIRLSHTNAFAVDVSGWMIRGDISFTLPQGTVLPAMNELVIASSLSGFQSRTSSPKPGERRLVVGGFKGALDKARQIELADHSRQAINVWRRP